MVQEQSDKLYVPFIGRPVITRCYVDASFGMLIGDDADTEIRIEGTFQLNYPDKQLEFSPDDQFDRRSVFGPALDLYGKTIEHIIAFEDGGLEVAFKNGPVLTVLPDPHYEPWELVSKDGRRIVSLPGGGLAKWSPVSNS